MMEEARMQDFHVIGNQFELDQRAVDAVEFAQADLSELVVKLVQSNAGSVHQLLNRDSLLRLQQEQLARLRRA